MPGHKEIPGILDGLKELHATKSAGYGANGDALANYHNVAKFSHRPDFMYALDRIVEKVTRAYNLEANGRLDDMAEEFLDICLIAALAEAMRRDFVNDYDRPKDDPTIIALQAVQRPLPNKPDHASWTTLPPTAFGERIG